MSKPKCSSIATTSSTESRLSKPEIRRYLTELFKGGGPREFLLLALSSTLKNLEYFAFNKFDDFVLIESFSEVSLLYLEHLGSSQSVLGEEKHLRGLEDLVSLGFEEEGEGRSEHFM